jgi:Family of unknown function (DUF5329)
MGSDSNCFCSPAYQIKAREIESDPISDTHMTISMHKIVLLLALRACWSATRAEELPQSAVREIEQLLGALGSSGCRFYRNGSWYDAEDAQAHLTKKYEYLRNKKLIVSAEDFIAKGGTESSKSGKPYQVRCGQEGAVPSAIWLEGALRRLRSGASPR